MVAIGPKLAAACLLLTGILAADTHDEIVDRVAAIASALSDDNAAGFMAGFDKAMPDYDTLRAQVFAMTDQAYIESDVEFIKDTGDEKQRNVDLDWYLELRSRIPDGPVVHRREVLHCEFRKEGKKWLIVSIAPISFFEAANFETKKLNLMPLPAAFALGQGKFLITPSLRFEVTGYDEPRLHRGISRVFERLSLQTGLQFENANSPATFIIRCDHAGEPVQNVREDESYQLKLKPNHAELVAPNPLGILRGLETFLQLVEYGQSGWFASTITIDDRPRFAWRGLELDVARHFMPVEILKRNIDGMAVVKLNVLHLHLSDDQGFRVESKVYPRLQGMGSDGQFYTQSQIRELVAYARDRGIRIIPEFDMPGHCTSWLVGYPFLAIAPGPYQIERRWGVFSRAMDPSRDSTYRFLDAFIGEMAQLFPDEYFHIGGDEVQGLQAQNEFTRRVQAIVAKHGKYMEGWDEILDASLPKDTLIQAWHGPHATIVGNVRNPNAVADATRLGFPAVESAGYYLDLMYPASYHYAIDPVEGVPPDRQSKVLGGEACMWTEYAGPHTVDSRIWPRMAAIAERFWSPSDIRDVDSMYERLPTISRKLDYVGLTHNSSQPSGPLRTMVEVLEPVQGYARGRQPGQKRPTQLTALDQLVDIARPDSLPAHRFASLVNRMQTGKIRDWLGRWQHNRVTAPSEAVPLSEELNRVAGIGLSALNYLESGRAAPSDWVTQQLAILRAAEQPRAQVTLAIVPSIEKLVMAAAANQTARNPR